jgi:RND family efflux transporter MFP subunit
MTMNSDFRHLRPNRKFGAVLIAAAAVLLLNACGKAPDASDAGKVAAKPALTVTTTTPQIIDWPQTLPASGNIAAWQEAVIGPELSNYRITEVLANIGDRVKKGQLLARIAEDAVDNELAEMRASVAEADATLAEARANQERSRQLTESGFYSDQQNTQSKTAVNTALARLKAAQARLQSAALKRSKAAVLSPDDGIVSGRSATVGTLTQTGQELFRLIRGGRLEWRAEVGASDLGRIKPGQTVILDSPGGDAITGRVRAVAPTVDPQTLNALIYVDLPADASKIVGAGMFARGEFQLGGRDALTLPQSAVLLREGFAYVFKVAGDRVTQTKVVTGRRQADRIELLESGGLTPESPVVASGVGFLADGDVVRSVAPTPSR